MQFYLINGVWYSIKELIKCNTMTHIISRKVYSIQNSRVQKLSKPPQFYCKSTYQSEICGVHFGIGLQRPLIWYKARPMPLITTFSYTLRPVPLVKNEQHTTILDELFRRRYILLNIQIKQICKRTTLSGVKPNPLYVRGLSLTVKLVNFECNLWVCNWYL